MLEQYSGKVLQNSEGFTTECLEVMMKIKVPVAKLVTLIGHLISYAKDGISKEEAAALGVELLGIAASLLGDEIVLPLREGK
jgi:hypothetical protein